MAIKQSANVFGFHGHSAHQIWLKNAVLLAAMVACTGFLFYIDIRFDRGTLDGYPYLAPLVLASFINARNAAFPAAFMLAGVAILGYAHSDTPTEVIDHELVGVLNVAIAVVSLFGTAFAIEHHRNLRAQLAEKLEQLRSGEEMRNRILSVIAHDLRSPLMPIIGFGSMLADYKDKLSSQQVGEYGSGIAQSAQRLLKTLDDLLDWARSTGAGRAEGPKRVDLYALVHDAAGLMTPVAVEKGLRLAVDVGPCEVFADPTGVGTILRNLIGNAVKFSPADSVIEISARPSPDAVAIVVADHGIGMPPTLVQSLNSARQIRSREGTAGERGTGLGLMICRTLAEKSGGTLAVRSRENEGTTVTVTLPRPAPAAKAA